MKSETAEIDIVAQTLNEQHDVYAKAREEYRRVIQQQRDEIERLRWENANMEKLWGKSEGTWMEIRDKQDAEIERLRDLVKKWQALEKEAAMYVEGVICMRSAHFTGEEPYVGWLGLGKALTKDYDDMKRMREALQNIASKNPFHNQCPPAGDTNYYGKLIAEMIVIANAALKEKE